MVSAESLLPSTALIVDSGSIHLATAPVINILSNSDCRECTDALGALSLRRPQERTLDCPLSITKADVCLNVADTQLGGITALIESRWRSLLRHDLSDSIMLPTADEVRIYRSTELSVILRERRGGWLGNRWLMSDANDGQWVIGANAILGDPSWFDWVDETAIFESALTEAQINAQVDAFFASADPLLGFSSDVTEVASNSTVQLSWRVSDAATAVTINGRPCRRLC